MSKNKNWKDRPVYTPFTPIEISEVEEEPVLENSGAAAQQLVESTDVEAAKPKPGTCPGCGQTYATEAAGIKLRCINCSINVTLK